jgi:homopolymeric O-antigen transport system ATP-binding protein
MAWSVRFEGVSKRYRGGGPRYPSVRHDLGVGFRRLLRGLVRAGFRAPGTLALDDVSFEVEQGEAFAIVGPNGAGKTTALKIVSRITYPTGGRMRLRGRVGALIEVGSGVHLELTARENIRLYGQILGMSPAQVRREFDAIVEFAELADALDTPVKMYSLGMQLRLGFSIAAFLQPEVFVVDEALAVGDARFQAKCVERMRELVRGGRTLLFVSHNLAMVEATCRRALFLLDGQARQIGPVHEVLGAYIAWVDEGQRQRQSALRTPPGGDLVVDRVTLHAASGEERYVFDSGDAVEIRIHATAATALRNTRFSICVADTRALIGCAMTEREAALGLTAGAHVVTCRVASVPLSPGTYEVWLSVHEPAATAGRDRWTRVGAFRIRPGEEPVLSTDLVGSWMEAPLRIPHTWGLDGR